MEMINSNPSHSSGTVREAQSITLEYQRLERARSNALNFLAPLLVLKQFPAHQHPETPTAVLAVCFA